MLPSFEREPIPDATFEANAIDRLVAAYELVSNQANDFIYDFLSRDRLIIDAFAKAASVLMKKDGENMAASDLNELRVCSYYLDCGIDKEFHEEALSSLLEFICVFNENSTEKMELNVESELTSDCSSRVKYTGIANQINEWLKSITYTIDVIREPARCHLGCNIDAPRSKDEYLRFIHDINGSKSELFVNYYYLTFLRRTKREDKDLMIFQKYYDDLIRFVELVNTMGKPYTIELSQEHLELVSFRQLISQ